ncbi:nitroreductase family protein [Neobacillus fumarioli]|uniref:nitroreductase family protein n=1 Tax=Neobacillus fumarioli TaxID=105229 RepID=UPI0009FF06DA|nr:nitroreductase family protein [Neobacillus fumarioli]
MNMTKSSIVKSLSEVIKERHSVRKYDPNFSIPKEEIEDILKEAVLAPSSSNLQPWRFIVIQDQEEKKELKKIAFNQEQVETASAVIAILGDKEMFKSIEKVYQSAFEAGFLDETRRDLLIKSANNLYPNAPEELRKEIAIFDAGLVSMQIMLIAKDRGYDTVPMGGFNKEQFARKYNVPERYFPIILLPIGKAAAPAHKTTRLPLEDLLIEYI